jgi:hypothetical protein
LEDDRLPYDSMGEAASGKPEQASCRTLSSIPDRTFHTLWPVPLFLECESVLKRTEMTENYGFSIADIDVFTAGPPPLASPSGE